MSQPLRILVVGSGGREHALAWKLARSPLVEKLFVAPGNGGTAALNVDIAADDIEGIRDFCLRQGVSLVVPGPELPLTLGLADALAEAGIPCFGPDKFCAQLEGSKSFAKTIMKKAGVPTAESAVFDDLEKALVWLKDARMPLVIKADGLAAGKGVIIVENRETAAKVLKEMLADGVFGNAGARVVVEEKLDGEEVSLICICDGETVLPMSSAQDHKAAEDGDKGPNTGGMGAYSPAPALPDADLERMTDMVVRPVLKEMAALGHPFRGALYAGLMLTPDGPKVLEYNARFGDPECQPLLMRLENDLAELLLAAATGNLQEEPLRFSGEASCGVVLAADGYPGKYEKGMPIEGIAEASHLAQVFHAGTRLESGKPVSSGGRVLCVTAMGRSLEEAQKKAYSALERINMPKSRFRSDIGAKGIKRDKMEREKN